MRTPEKLTDTIVAISTAPGRGGIGIVRLSGNKAPAIASAIFFCPQKGEGFKAFDASCAPHGQMVYGEARVDGFFDRGYLVFFKAPHSFTGEDIVEFHLHGGVRILSGIVEKCVAEGARAAESGEFTRRAFINGKLSLVEAEGIIDMINAESAAAVRAAAAMMSGRLGERFLGIQERLSAVIQNMEVVLDYPEETEDEVLPESKAEIEGILADLKKLLGSASVGLTAKEGINAVIAGPPNAGKSSLLNSILKRERAIVSPYAGTTRDLVTESVEYEGLKINLTDSAGLRPSEDKIEQIGVDYAKSAILNADAVIFLENEIAASFAEEFAFLKDLPSQKKIIHVQNKCDLHGGDYGKTKDGIFRISAKTGDGVKGLLDEIVKDFKAGERQYGADVMSSARAVSALTSAVASLESAHAAFDNFSTDCVLIDLREAYLSLGQITGSTAEEDIVEGIFARFCVGK